MTKKVQKFAFGGDVSLNDVIKAYGGYEKDDEDTINTDPMGSAQKYMADLQAAGQPVEQTSYSASPTKQTIKRTRVAPISDNNVKGMTMSLESLTKGQLGDIKGITPKARDTLSAKGQMEELVRQYKLKTRAAEEAGKGLMAGTFKKPTLEGPSLEKRTLSRKRFADGGEATAPTYSKGLPAPSLMNVSLWADTVSRDMYPDKADNAKRDAARHMLAAAILADKTSPGVAKFLGKAHEWKEAPIKTTGHWLGLSEPRSDYATDIHNNALGTALHGSASNLRELERSVMDAIGRGGSSIEPGRVSLKPDETAGLLYVDKPGQTQPPEYEKPAKRADGSPESGEIMDPETQAAQTAIGRNMSNEEFLRQAGYGLADVPYAMAGAPVDIATMLMRPFGYKTEKPVMSSEWIKGKMTDAGIRPADTTEERLQGPRQAAELLGSLINPAGVARKVGPVVEKGVKAGATEVGKQLDRAIMEGTGPLAKAVPEAAKPMYAVRPEGSMMMVEPFGDATNPLGNLISEGRRGVLTFDTKKDEAIESFWDTKAKNYFERQFGTESDPIYRSIAEQSLRSPAIKKEFPAYILDQLKVGKEKVNPVTGESRFYPKYPEAAAEMRGRYDALSDTKASKVIPGRELSHPDYTYSLNKKGEKVQAELQEKEIDKMLAQGTPASMANVKAELITQSLKDPNNLIGPYGARDILHFYDLARRGELPSKMTIPQKYISAVEKGETIYSASPARPLRALFDPENINNYLSGLSTREIEKIRFEDAVKGGAKIGAKKFERQTLADDIRSGKRIDNKFFEEGVSAPMYQVPEGQPYAGYAWKRITDPEATVAEGAWVGHSVGGYAKGGNYGSERNKLFQEGKYQVYTLRDNRNRPVTTIEVRMDAEDMPVVTQIKGNGKLSGNTAAVDYQQPVYDFLTNVLKPVEITESDNYLSPLIQGLKDKLRQ